MKINNILFMAVLAILFSLNANAQKKYTTYDLDKIVSVTSLTDTQVTLLKPLITERDEALSKAINDDEKYTVNKTYYGKLAQVLDGNQLLKFNESKINMDAVDKWTKKRYDNFIESFPFMGEYNVILNDMLYATEYEKAYLNLKYFFDDGMRSQELQKTKDSQNVWKKLAQNATYPWSLNTSKCQNIEASQGNSFLKYYFFRGLLETPNATVYNKDLSKEYIVQNLQKITNQDAFKALGESLVNCRIKEAIAFDKRLKALDSVSQSYAHKEIYSHLKKEFLKNKAAFEPLQLEVDYELRMKGLQAGKEAHEGLKIEALKAKAIKAGLDEQRAQALVDLVEKKNADLKALKERGNQGDDAFSDIFEDSAYDTKKQILKDFGEGLNDLVSKKEFGVIFKERFIKSVKKETKAQLKEISAKYELDKEQFKEVNQLVYAYFLNVAITKAYFKYNKPSQKQKMSALHYHFEKNYKALMNGFDIKVKDSKKQNDRTYKW